MNQEERVSYIGPIVKSEIAAAHEAWGAGVVAIGKAYESGQDYVQVAEDHIDRLYDYGSGPVLFAPTRASEIPFRPTRAGALSYFVGGSSEYPEDHGFALRPWRKVRFTDVGLRLIDDCALSMGHYTFTSDDDELMAEFTLAYRHDEEGRLRIVLHHSSLPYGAT